MALHPDVASCCSTVKGPRNALKPVESRVPPDDETHDFLGRALFPGAVPGYLAGYPGSPQTTQASHVVPAVIRALSTGTALRSQL